MSEAKQRQRRGKPKNENHRSPEISSLYLTAWFLENPGVTWSEILSVYFHSSPSLSGMCRKMRCGDVSGESAACKVRRTTNLRNIERLRVVRLRAPDSQDLIGFELGRRGLELDVGARVVGVASSRVLNSKGGLEDRISVVFIKVKST